MQESNLEVYKISKLRKFMTTIRFMMQDSLRFLVLNSLTDYNKLIASVSSQKVVINGTSDVRVWDSNAQGRIGGTELGGKRPLFLIDLVWRNGQLKYNIDLTQYETVVLAAFDKALGAVEGLPDLEPVVMDQMFWATKPTLQTPHSKEANVVHLRERLRQAIRDGVEPLERYIRKFDKHIPLLSLDISQYAQEYENENHSVDEMERDIVRHMQEWEALDKDIPSHINLGLFWVSCENVRAAMRKDLSKVVLDLLNRRTGKLAQSISQSFTTIQQRLKDRPLKIEELTELREFMRTVPDIVRSQVARISEMLHNYEILERHRYELSNEDFRARWQAFSWPGKVDEMLRTTEATVEADENSFMRNLTQDQEIFKERVHTLGTIIADFSKNTDMSRLNEIVIEVHKISMELKECQNLVTLFNSRERLFNLEVTHYEEVAQLNKDFEPYRSLWLTAADWTKWRNQWLHGSFLELSAEDVERNLMNAWRTVFKSVKHFKNVPGCLAVANQVCWLEGSFSVSYL